MPRKARNAITASYIHVITQGIKREFIFPKDKYKAEYLKLLNKIFEEYNNLYILSYCIMDNHAHLLIYTDNISKLSKAMSRVNTSYGIFYNKRRRRVGYVFRDRYYAQEIKDEQHLYNTVVYIHKNPVKAKMVTKMDDYLYSSYLNFKNNKVHKYCIDLLFHTKNYHDFFNYIHKNFDSYDVIDIDENHASVEEINEFLENVYKKYKVQKEDIIKNNYLVIQVYKELKDEFNLTNKEITEILGLGKNRISNILRSQKDIQRSVP